MGDDIMVELQNSKQQKEYINKRGVHVIVGQYMGKGYPWEATPNLTDQLINANYYSPVPKMGENWSTSLYSRIRSEQNETNFSI